LVEFAKASFDLMMVQDDGSTKKQHLENVQRQTGIKPEELNVPEMPRCCEQVWNWFIQLNNARQSGMSANPLSYSDIYAFFKLIDVQPTEDELDIIRILDGIVLEIFNKEQKKASKKK
jgi:hypothetical protein